MWRIRHICIGFRVALVVTLIAILQIVSPLAALGRDHIFGEAAPCVAKVDAGVEKVGDVTNLGRDPPVTQHGSHIDCCIACSVGSQLYLDSHNATAVPKPPIAVRLTYDQSASARLVRYKLIGSGARGPPV